MKRNILITLDDEAWPELDFAVFIYDPDDTGKIAPRLQRVSLYDTAFPNFEVHSSNALREAISEVLMHGKESHGKERSWQERPQSNGRIRGRETTKRQRSQSHKPQAGRGDRVLRAAKSKTKKKVRPRGMTKWYAAGRKKVRPQAELKTAVSPALSCPVDNCEWKGHLFTEAGLKAHMRKLHPHEGES